MPQRSIWSGSFVYAFLFENEEEEGSSLNRKIWSFRSSISPELVDYSVPIYKEPNGWQLKHEIKAWLRKKKNTWKSRTATRAEAMANSFGGSQQETQN